jgi:hypothetical protein
MTFMGTQASGRPISLASFFSEGSYPLVGGGFKVPEFFAHIN